MDFNNIKMQKIVWMGHYFPPKKKWVAENRKTHIVGIQLSGTVVHKINGKAMPFSEGCIYFLNVKDDYSCEVATNEKTESFSIHFTTYGDIDTESFFVKAKNLSEIYSLYEKLSFQYAINPSGDNITASYFYRILDCYEKIRQKKYAPNDSRMIAVKEYMDEHFIEKDCLEKAHATCRVSRRRFNELFKNQFDVTPNRYIIIRKIEHAKHLLLLGNLSVSEIADACGFIDICYFSNVFKKETGYAPAKYRYKTPQ
jgi:AraC-like DNA-binding protein